MQNKYIADVGDFGKFQLFRFLFNHSDSPLNSLPLAQIWFFHHGEDENNNDGKHINYFEKMKGHDAFLEKGLQKLIRTNERNLQGLASLNLLDDIKFFYDEVPKEKEQREVWLEKAKSFTQGSKVVAVAPDNGMALKCQRAEKEFVFLGKEDFKQKKEAHKYIFADEVEEFYNLKHIELTIVYQHLGRCFSHNEQIEVILKSLQEKYLHIVAIKHKPYSPRVFFFLCKSEKMKDEVVERLRAFTEKFVGFWEIFE